MSRPSIFPSEWALRRAWNALAEVEAESELTPEQADELLATYVDREAAIAKRDELGDFLDGMDAIAAAKLEQAKQLTAQSRMISEGIERMKGSIVRLMTALGVTELRGNYRRLVTRRTPPSVEVLNEDQIPASFHRVREDDDINAIVELRAIVEKLVAKRRAPDDDELDADERAHTLMLAAQARRYAIDKKAILAAWRENDNKDCNDAGEPIVPGAARVTATKLDVK